MTNTSTPLRDRVLDRDDDLRDVLQLLLRGANRRQMWIHFMDERGCLGSPIIPIDDYPDDPDQLVDIADLGRVSEAHVIMSRADAIREATANASIVLVWERVGDATASPADRGWARSMEAAAEELGVPLRAQFIAHDNGVRQLHPDDFL